MALYMNSLWGELSAYLVKRYFDPDFPYFYHLSNQTNGKSIVLMIAAVLFGVLAAGTVYVYQRRVVGAIPRALVAADASDEARARTLPELGIRVSWMTKLVLKNRAGALRRYVRFVGEGELTPEDFGKRARRAVSTLDFEGTPCYIPEERLSECKKRFDLEKAGGWGTVVWFWIGGIVLFFLLCRALPTVMGIIDRLAGALG